MPARNDFVLMTNGYIRLLFEFICQPNIPHPYRPYEGIHHIDIKEKRSVTPSLGQSWKRRSPPTSRITKRNLKR